MYANVPTMFRKIQRQAKKIFSMYWVCIRGNIFDIMELQQRYPENPFVTDEACLLTLCQHVQLPFVKHM